MEIDEHNAYAVAAWHRFDLAITDSLLRAVAGAYALIVCSDGELTQSEVDGFVATVITSARLPQLNAERLENVFRDLCDSVMSGGDGRARALDAVRAMSGREPQNELVAHAARLAIDADGAVRDQERAVLSEVYDTLKVDLNKLAKSSKRS
jgi:tellurite resistance protein